MNTLELLKEIKGKPACGRGHPLNPKNAYEHPNGQIRCKVCRADHAKRYYQKNRDAIRAHKKTKRAQ